MTFSDRIYPTALDMSLLEPIVSTGYLRNSIAYTCKLKAKIDRRATGQLRPAFRLEFILILKVVKSESV
jgi:hypothetical protein